MHELKYFETSKKFKTKYFSHKRPSFKNPHNTFYEKLTTNGYVVFCRDLFCWMIFYFWSLEHKKKSFEE